MAAEMDPLREKTQRLNEVLRQCQMENVSKYSTMQKAAFKGEGGDILGNSVVDQSFSAPLITEYDKHLEELNGQVKYYQKQVGEMKLQLESVIKENERLHSELKDAVVKQLEALPFGTEMGNDIYIDDETVRNLQEQLQLANKEKNYVLELWQNVSQELDKVKKIYQENKAQIQVIEGRKQKVNTQSLSHTYQNQLSNSHQLNEQLYVNSESIEMDNQHLLKTVTEQSVEIEKLRKQLRLCVTVQEATQLRADKTHLEKQTRELQAKYNELENERYEAVVTARNSMQLLEEANLQKNQALLEEKQKEEDIEKIKKSFSQLMQEAATRAKKEIFNTRKQYHVQISQLTEELSVLQMECAEKQGQIERVIKEKKAVEEELEKVYREGKVNENHYRKLEEMHQRCLVAECSKDDLQLRLKTAENKLKQLEINSSEEISRCQEMIQKLQNALESERENCGFVSEQRLKLQQENEQLQKETEDLRKMALEAQKKAKLKISAMEHEFSVKEHGFEVQLREMEDSNRNSTVELRHLLATQQKAANRWKEETKRATESAEMRISNLKSELSRQKLHTQELLSQLEMANEKVAESEKLILEHQEKANRLQRRLSQAEQRAASASQQLSVVTVQRRKAASMMNLENI
ncbi:PREDICTED: sodium channel and clathrin linker 1 isoform X5 [Myotis brandtii]|uniref:sodium channel and clathrin linker 1 isoform X5 n=1 Tax=Myotis brandtii TaxID=109478 RepID=UPI0003BBA564|nr:PREDICTED: sodium channel and clathrin linker 1 isoform X5 [Myotis brandtii]